MAAAANPRTYVDRDRQVLGDREFPAHLQSGRTHGRNWLPVVFKGDEFADGVPEGSTGMPGPRRAERGRHDNGHYRVGSGGGLATAARQQIRG